MALNGSTDGPDINQRWRPWKYPVMNIAQDAKVLSGTIQGTERRNLSGELLISCPLSEAET